MEMIFKGSWHLLQTFSFDDTSQSHLKITFFVLKGIITRSTLHKTLYPCFMIGFAFPILMIFSTLFRKEKKEHWNILEWFL